VVAARGKGVDAGPAARFVRKRVEMNAGEVAQQAPTPWVPFVAHLALLAAVYALLLAVVNLAFRGTTRRVSARSRAPSEPSDDLRDADLAASTETPIVAPVDLPLLSDHDFDLPDLDEWGRGDTDTSELTKLRSEGGLRSSNRIFARIDSQLDAVMANNHVPEKPREILSRAARKFEEQRQHQDDSEMLQEMRRAEIVRRKNAAERDAAERAMAATQAPPAAEQSPAPTRVIQAPLDAVYGADPVASKPEPRAPSVMMSAEERIMAMHIKSDGF
jgi:hypothetical protein